MKKYCRRKRKVQCYNYNEEGHIKDDYPKLKNKVLMALSVEVSAQWKFLLVAVDYFSKWIEVEPLARITEQMRLKEWCGGYGIQQAFTFVAYPPSNGQAEVANREILRVLRARLDHMGGSWVDELPSVLWALRTTPKEGTGATPFHLVYGDEAVIPVEVGVELDQLQHYDKDNTEPRLLELDLVDEARAKVVVRLMAYHQRMKQSYNQRVIPR
ncbi:uncharacterized protein LOC122048498 [Zingiber officinale]|uniref:uncharacterized protein LOC122048498 n=1 Tax=Zingiber officinale TaxID=94328 RepID=UPI001C4D908C|nr:uncharacterized protein LOC122048498 [Zingiber officinale]